MPKITLKKFMEGLRTVEERENRRCTLLGIGPMSSNLLEAPFQLAKQKDCPLMFIASRNQMDADELGGGYVCAWDQQRFSEDIAKISRKCEFDGLYYLCRDHGAPGSAIRSVMISCPCVKPWSWVNVPMLMI